MEERERKRLNKSISVLIYILPILIILISIFVGRYPIPAKDIVDTMMNGLAIQESSFSTMVSSVIFYIRLPRILMGFVVGGALAISGATLQGIFRNPLVDSGMLGVSNGASFGAVLGFVFFEGDYFWVLFLAFAIGSLAVLLSYLIASIYKTVPTIMLVLGGVIVSSLFSSLVSLGKYMADPYDELPAIVFWLMGSLSGANYQDLAIILLPVCIGSICIYLLRWRINILSLGDREALTLGVNVKWTKGLLVICTTLITAAAVSVSGTIGWIGLIIPHIVRMLIGNDNRHIIPASFMVGGGFLILIDNVSRTISTSEIPIGVLTSLIGAPFYILLLRRTKGNVW